jgi:uncharacterized protein (DUF58 family)
VAGVTLTVAPGAWGIALFLPTLALLLFLWDYARSPNPQLLRATLIPPSALSVGRPEALEITISLEGRRDSLPVRVILLVRGELKALPPGEAAPGAGRGAPGAGGDGREGQGGPKAATVPLRDGAGSLVFTLAPRRRGWAYLDRLWISYRGPLGFAETRRQIPIGHNLTILQDIRRVHEEALAVVSDPRSIGQRSQPFLGEGSEFENLADFSQGMDNRHIDWKRSARHRRLLAKEFRQERNQPIVLGFDTGRLMLEPVGTDTRLDHFIRAGLSLGWISLRSGDLVGGCAFDLFFRQFLPPGRTPSFFTKLQRFAARLNYAPEETNFTLSLTELASRLRQRSLVVLFTEFSDAANATLLLECLELLIKKHVVIFVSTPDPVTHRLPEGRPESFEARAEAVIADKLNRERAVVLGRMNRLGIHTIDSKGPALSGALISRYLSIKRRGQF